MLFTSSSSSNDGTGISTPVDPESGTQVPPSSPVAEPATQTLESGLNLIQRMCRPIWRRLRSEELNKMIAIPIGGLFLVHMALCLAVSHVLKETLDKGVNRQAITTRQAKIVHSHLLILLSHGLGLFSMWNQRFWLAVIYLITLFGNGYYVFSLVFCTVRSGCPTTALFVAIPQLGSLVWVYWLMLGWLYVLIALVGYYVGMAALDKFGLYEDDSSPDSSISWPVDSSDSGPEEPNQELNAPVPADPYPVAVACTSGSNPTYLTMFPNLTQDVGAIFKLVTPKVFQTAEAGPSQSIMMNNMVQSVSSTDLTTVVKNKFQGTVARFWNADPKYQETAL